MAKYRIGVLILDEAGDRLKAVLFPRYLKQTKAGYYFNCDAIDASGPLLTMTVPSVNGAAEPDTVEVQIPYAYVMLTMKVSGSSPFGFAEA